MIKVSTVWTLTEVPNALVGAVVGPLHPADAPLPVDRDDAVSASMLFRGARMSSTPSRVQ